MKFSIVHKLSLISIFLVLISAGVVGSVFYTKTTDILVENALKRIAIDTQEAGDALQQIIDVHTQDLLILANTPPFQGLIRARSGGGIDEQDTTSYLQWISRMQAIFESMLEKKKKYLAVRFIDKSGDEIVSVRWEDSKIIRVKPGKLQNKMHRPYVSETLKLPIGKVYLSDFNLNQEYGKVSIPYQEVLRIATPIYDERNKSIEGLAIITLETGAELRSIQSRIANSSESNIYVTNDEGGYLLHPETGKTYGFDLKKRFRIQEDIPQLAEEFLPESFRANVMLMPNETNGKDVVNITKVPFDTYNPERFIAVVMTQSYENIVEEVSDVLSQVVSWALLLAMGAASLAVLFSIRITRPLQQMTQAVDEFSNRGTLTTSLPVSLGDEVGVLARSFSSMIKQVEQSQTQLERMNVNLESMVLERTSDLNKAFVEAERANAAKSDFLSRMSHELRTPMNAILGFGQLLKLDSDSFNKTQRTNTDEILNAGHHLLGLINDVLDLTRVEAGKLSVSMEDVNIDVVMQQCISLIHPLAKSRDIILTDHVTGKEYIVLADFIRLKQVLVNLFSNAVKYNRKHGQITIDSKIVDEKRLRILISDSGEGLSEEDISKLFTPFERLNKENNVEGAGIGLVITKHLMELMGGNIGVESTPGKGSTFWVELDMKDISND